LTDEISAWRELSEWLLDSSDIVFDLPDDSPRGLEGGSVDRLRVVHRIATSAVLGLSGSGLQLNNREMPTAFVDGHVQDQPTRSTPELRYWQGGCA